MTNQKDYKKALKIVNAKLHETNHSVAEGCCSEICIRMMISEAEQTPLEVVSYMIMLRDKMGLNVVCGYGDLFLRTDEHDTIDSLYAEYNKLKESFLKVK